MMPCPFCGSDNLREVRSETQTQIECTRCSALGPFALGDSESERSNGAKKLWNMRAKASRQPTDGIV